MISSELRFTNSNLTSNLENADLGKRVKFRLIHDKTYSLTFRLRYSLICQESSIRRQQSDLFGLRVKLPPITTSLTTQR